MSRDYIAVDPVLMYKGTVKGSKPNRNAESSNYNATKIRYPYKFYKRKANYCKIYNQVTCPHERYLRLHMQIENFNKITHKYNKAHRAHQSQRDCDIFAPCE